MTATMAGPAILPTSSPGGPDGGDTIVGSSSSISSGGAELSSAAMWAPNQITDDVLALANVVQDRAGLL